MIRRLAVTLCGVLLAALVAVAVPGTASACSCMAQTLDQMFPSADVVFVGSPGGSVQPQSIDGAMSSAAPVRWAFAVESVHRGDVSRDVTVSSPLSSASCGIDFVVGRRYLVLATRDATGLQAHLCGGTLPMDEVPALTLAALGSGTVPTADPPVPSFTPSAIGTPADAPGTSRRTLLGQVALIVVLGVGGAFLVRRRRRR